MAFTKAHKNIELSEGGALATKKTVWGLAFDKTAICAGHVMARGRHYAEFECVKVSGKLVCHHYGVCRPGCDVGRRLGWSVESESWGIDSYQGDEAVCIDGSKPAPR